MADPTLKSASVQINYTGSDGYRSEVGFSSTRTKAAPHLVLVEGLEELARVLALFGYETDARAAVDAACKRVAERRANREKTS